MQKKFGEDEYNFHPKTYLFPEQYHEFIEFLEERKRVESKVDAKKWIFKPDNTSSGYGIFIFDSHTWKASPLQTHWNSYLEKLEEEKLGLNEEQTLNGYGSDSSTSSLNISAGQDPNKPSDKPEEKPITSGVI